MNVEFWLIFIGATCLLLLVWAFIFITIRSRLAKAKRGTIQQQGDSLHVPLVAAFSGWKRLPWLSFSHSNIAPRLVLHPDRVACKVVFTRIRPYAAISRVDYRRGIGTENVVLEFSDSLVSFSGNTANRALARAAVRLLRERGCPLSERAERLLTTS
ncbi:hypothetical protein ACLBXM_16475 [Xanthobacteraceae bacterium A53D]